MFPNPCNPGRMFKISSPTELRQGIQVDDWLALLGLLGVIGIASMLFAGLHTTSLGYLWIESKDPN